MACSTYNLVNYGTEINQSIKSEGRGLFATRSFKAGEKIIEEDPLFSCQFSWNIAYGYSACEFCMRPLETAEENARRLSAKSDYVLPFPECDETNKTSHKTCLQCGVVYCNNECKEKAWRSYHKTLCYNSLEGNNGHSHPLEELNDTWKQMHYPPETTSIMLMAKILANIIQNSEREEIKKQLMLMCHNTVNLRDKIAHKLLGKEFENQIEKLRNLMMKALGTSETLEFLNAEGFRSLFTLIGRNGQGIGTSSFSVWVRNVTAKISDGGVDSLIDCIYDDMEKESGDFLNNEGSALFAVQSACNHSCDPNVETTFPYSNHTLVMVALKDIAIGEELFISYIDECALSRSRHSRRKILKENYLFHCQCERCEKEIDLPDVTSDEESMEEN